MKRFLVLVLVLVLLLSLLTVDGAGDDNACRVWDADNWNVDADCYASKENMGCADGYRLEASNVVCAGEGWGWAKAYSYKCVPCDAGDVMCQGNLERDPMGLYAETCIHDLSQVVCAIVMKVSAALSILGSSVI